MDILRIVKVLDLPDWWIGAGFVRSKVWDYLHGYTIRTAIPDIDIIFFDKNNTTKSYEKEIENFLKKKDPNVFWSVKNQARMHILHDDAPYKDSTEGLSRWVETATCIGIKLNPKNNLILTAPHGTYDLVNLILRPTNNTVEGQRKFEERIKSKHWIKKWPKLQIIP